MAVAQLGDDADGVQACVLGQRGWNYLQGFCKGSHAICLHALNKQTAISSTFSDAEELLGVPREFYNGS